MPREGIVNQALLAVYEERDIRHIQTDELLYGMRVKITNDYERDRYRIETDYHYTGLVYSTGLLCDVNAVQNFMCKKKIQVIHSFCDVLSQPTVKSCILLTLYRGSVLADHGAAAQPGWHCVGLVDGTEGYVRKEYVEELPDKDTYTREQIVNTALSYLGTPYRWGGKSTLGIDCSGFTFMTYALNGVYIHRDSAWQSSSPVRKIADCEKKPGDLLYFPGHIALYLGNGEYIHSTARDGAGVTTNNLFLGRLGYREDLARSYLFAGSVFHDSENGDSYDC